VIGKNLTDTTGVRLVHVKDDSMAEPLSNVQVQNDTTLTAVVPSGFTPGKYNAEVTTPVGTGRMSAVKYQVSKPVELDKEQGSVETSDSADIPDDGVVPVNTTMSTDDQDDTGDISEHKTRAKMRIEAGTSVLDQNGNPYTGTLHPPRQVPLTEDVSAQVGEDAVVLTFGAEEPLQLGEDETIVVDAQVVRDKDAAFPFLYYLNPNGKIELAGVACEKDGQSYAPGGTILAVEPDTPETGLSTLAIGVCLDHMSDYAVGYQGDQRKGPAIEKIQPDQGPLVGGNVVEIHSNNVEDGATVTLGEQNCEVDAIQEGVISCVAPAREKIGAVDVTVTNPDGLSDTQAEGYTYVKNPDPTPAGSVGPSGGGCFIQTID
jgi:hypothetical protein